MRLRDDPRPNESQLERAKRNQDEVSKLLSKDKYTVVVSPTLIKGADDDEVNRIVGKIRAGINPVPKEAGLITPGHISVHTPNQALSHRNPSRQSSEPLGGDINDTMKKNYDTYVAIFPKENFPSASLSKEIGAFNLGAKDDGDNCSTAVQKCLLNEKDRAIMNPLATLNKLADASVQHTNPTDKEYDEATDLILAIGLDRGLAAVAQDYRQELASESTNQHIPLSPLKNSVKEEITAEIESEYMSETKSEEIEEPSSPSETSTNQGPR